MPFKEFIEKVSDWLKTNIGHEIPMLGHTLTVRTWHAFEHDLKHFFSMLLGMYAMLAIPMPMEAHENKGEQFVQEFFFMMLYMYLGMFIGGVTFNLGKTGLTLCKSVLYPSDPKNDLENQNLLHETNSSSSESVVDFS